MLWGDVALYGSFSQTVYRFTIVYPKTEKLRKPKQFSGYPLHAKLSSKISKHNKPCKFKFFQHTFLGQTQI